MKEPIMLTALPLMGYLEQVIVILLLILLIGLYLCMWGIQDSNGHVVAAWAILSPT